MMSNKSESVFKHVMVWLENREGTVSKIAVQKLLFFLKEKGVSLRYSFEPYTYGPFSKQVMDEAEVLSFKKEIVVSTKDYSRGEAFTETLQPEEQDKIDRFLDSFSVMLDGNFSFDNLEVFGTTLYCLRALQESGYEVNQGAVVEEFKEWKGDKYQDWKIEGAYEKVFRVFAAA